MFSDSTIFSINSIRMHIYEWVPLVRSTKDDKSTSEISFGYEERRSEWYQFISLEIKSIQVGLYTLKIDRLQEHLITNHKDSDVKKSLQRYKSIQRLLLSIWFY